MNKRDGDVVSEAGSDSATLDMSKLLGFEHLELSDDGDAEAAVAHIHNKRGEATQVSDRRLKTDVRSAGRAPNGLALYDFRYIGGDRVFRGVMAQDLLADPRFADAVETRAGYHRVDYAKIGLAHLATADMRNAGAAAAGESTPPAKLVAAGEGTPTIRFKVGESTPPAATVSVDEGTAQIRFAVSEGTSG